MRERIHDVLFYLLAIPLVLGMCLLYLVARLCGYDWEEDF
jgi:hypothetical protein